MGRTGGVLRGISEAEEAERGSIAVEEGGATDRPDLAVAEKAADRHVAEVFPEDACIEVGLTVEAHPAPEAGEEEGSGEGTG